jgi:response regulator RpfG family c-di-GMP phosphodiesterase
MSEKILMVDDEASVLDGYRRLLGRQFDLETALGPQKGLEKIDQEGSFAVVVSDMRMPGMNGIEFLTRVMERMPDAVRIMLTGNADLNTAVHAVNEGNIFRFLTKPCTKEMFSKTLTAALAQYRLIVAERDLLEKTLSGSIEVLVEVLSLVNPAAFGRATRVRRYIRQIAAVLQLNSPWQYEVAGLMSQLGCVSLQPETIEAVYAGKELPPDQQKRYDAHPMLAQDLLRKIPRMKEIGWMIAQQNSPESAADPDISEEARLGADILRAALAFDSLLATGASKDQAVDTLRSRYKEMDERVTHALREVDLDRGRMQIKTCPVNELSGGMILQEELRTNTGLLIVARGQEVTLPLLMKLKNFYQSGSVSGTVMVAVPTSPMEVERVAVGAFK